MPVDVSKAEFMRLMDRGLLMWPPYQFDGYHWAIRIQSEDKPREWVRCLV